MRKRYSKRVTYLTASAFESPVAIRSDADVDADGDVVGADVMGTFFLVFHSFSGDVFCTCRERELVVVEEEVSQS